MFSYQLLSYQLVCYSCTISTQGQQFRYFFHIKETSPSFRSTFKTRARVKSIIYKVLVFQMKNFRAIFIFSLSVFAAATLIENDIKRLIKTSEDDPGTWMTEKEIIALKISRIGFIDITDYRGITIENVTAQNIYGTDLIFGYFHREPCRNSMDIKKITFVNS